MVLQCGQQVNVHLCFLLSTATKSRQWIKEQRTTNITPFGKKRERISRMGWFVKDVRAREHGLVERNWTLVWENGDGFI